MVNNAVRGGGRDLPEIIIMLLNKSGFQHQKGRSGWVDGREEGGRERKRERGREGAREGCGRNLRFSAVMI